MAGSVRKYIIALDQGTTSSRAVLFDSDAQIAASCSTPVTQIYPKPGWVEHDPVEIWEGQLRVMRQVLSDTGISPGQVACIGIANQRETAVIWNRRTGKPLCNAIVWQCRRTSDTCARIAAGGFEGLIRSKTGLPVDAYFSGTKIRWMLDNACDDEARKMAEAGDLLAGTIDSWLVWNLTGGRLHVTDCTNASRTMLYNIHTLEWDKELLALLGIPMAILPDVVPSAGFVGETSAEILGMPVPITGTAGDQQASLFGQACFSDGSVKSTYGTGCFILMNTGNVPVVSVNNLITTIAWGIGNGSGSILKGCKVEYALEGSVFNAGSVVQWLRDGLGLIKSASETEAIAGSIPDTDGVYLVPAFTGLGAPYWDMHARGIITGITRGTRMEHIVRAALESIAFQVRDVVDAMQRDSGIRLNSLNSLKVDGGASVNRFLMQFQADILNTVVVRPAITETTALGAAYLAGLGAGIWHNIDELAGKWQLDSTFTPHMNEDERESRYARWAKAVDRSKAWA